jgi:hypothetical protein
VRIGTLGTCLPGTTLGCSENGNSPRVESMGIETELEERGFFDGARGPLGRRVRGAVEVLPSLDSEAVLEAMLTVTCRC